MTALDRPQLRPYLAAVPEDKEGRHFILWDQLRLADGPLRLSALERGRSRNTGLRSRRPVDTSGHVRFGIRPPASGCRVRCLTADGHESLGELPLIGQHLSGELEGSLEGRTHLGRSRCACKGTCGLLPGPDGSREQLVATSREIGERVGRVRHESFL